MFDGLRNKMQYNFNERILSTISANTGPELNAVTTAVKTHITLISQKAMRHRWCESYGQRLRIETCCPCSHPEQMLRVITKHLNPEKSKHYLQGLSPRIFVSKIMLFQSRQVIPFPKDYSYCKLGPLGCLLFTSDSLFGCRRLWCTSLSDSPACGLGNNVALLSSSI